MASVIRTIIIVLSYTSTVGAFLWLIIFSIGYYLYDDDLRHKLEKAIYITTYSVIGSIIVRTLLIGMTHSKISMRGILIWIGGLVT